MEYYVQELRSLYARNKWHVHSIGVAIAIVLAITAGVGYYYYSSLKLEEEAQRVIADHIVKLNNARKEKDVNWNEFDKMWEYDLQKYGSTHLAPYIIAYRAETQESAGRSEEALSLMKQAISRMKPTTMGYGLFATTLALMKMDSSSPQEQQEGMKELASLAHDMKNVDWERAAYYFGFYHLKSNSLEAAKDTFTRLTHNALPSSIWAERGRSALQLIDHLENRNKENKT